MNEPANATPGEQPKTLKVQFVKAPFFRSVFADASWGRLSPSGHIHLSFFNDCGQMPSIETHNIANGQLIHQSFGYTSDANITRQIEVDVVLSLESAKSVRDNLQNFIDILEKSKQAAL